MCFKNNNQKLYQFHETMLLRNPRKRQLLSNTHKCKILKLQYKSFSYKLHPPLITISFIIYIRLIIAFPYCMQPKAKNKLSILLTLEHLGLSVLNQHLLQQCTSHLNHQFYNCTLIFKYQFVHVADKHQLIFDTQQLDHLILEQLHYQLAKF